MATKAPTGILWFHCLQELIHFKPAQILSGSIRFPFQPIQQRPLEAFHLGQRNHTFFWKAKNLQCCSHAIHTATKQNQQGGYEHVFGTYNHGIYIYIYCIVGETTNINHSQIPIFYRWYQPFQKNAPFMMVLPTSSAAVCGRVSRTRCCWRDYLFPYPPCRTRTGRTGLGDLSISWNIWGFRGTTFLFSSTEIGDHFEWFKEKWGCNQAKDPGLKCVCNQTKMRGYEIMNKQE